MPSNKGRVGVIRKFIRGQPAKSGNYESDGRRLLVFGNAVAEWCTHEEESDYVELRDCRWRTASTKGTLNDFLRLISAPCGITQRKGVWYLTWPNDRRGEVWRGGLTCKGFEWQPHLFRDP